MGKINVKRVPAFGWCDKKKKKKKETSPHFYILTHFVHITVIRYRFCYHIYLKYQ